VIFSPHLAVHVVELPKFKKRPDEISDPLDMWCYFLLHGAELDIDALPSGMRNADVSKAMEVLQMVTQSDLERERYQSRLKAERDRISYVKDAFAEGIEKGLEKGRAEGIEKGLEKGPEKGLEKGRAEGIEKGELVGRIHVCQRLLNQGLTPASELIDLSIGELRTRAETLEKQLGLS
jgi:predicted transposase/invertase (TIGR01784 family)